MRKLLSILLSLGQLLIGCLHLLSQCWRLLPLLHHLLTRLLILVILALQGLDLLIQALPFLHVRRKKKLPPACGTVYSCL